MRVRRTKIRRSDGTGLAVVEFGGEGPGILLLHGMASRATTWCASAEWLTAHGRVIGYDARGHGLSDAPPGPYDRAAHIADAVAVIQKFDLAPAVVIGHSMGGLTAWQLAGAHSGLISAIVVGDMAAVVPDVQHRWRAWLADWPLPFATLADVRAYFSSNVMGSYGIGPNLTRPHPHEGDYFMEAFTEHDDGYWPLATVEHMLACREHWNNRDHTTELDAVTCPALVVAGEHSYFPVDGSRRMSQRLPAGQFTLVPDAGHILHYDNPTGWRSAVEPFVTKVLSHD